MVIRVDQSRRRNHLWYFSQKTLLHATCGVFPFIDLGGGGHVLWMDGASMDLCTNTSIMWRGINKSTSGVGPRVWTEGGGLLQIMKWTLWELLNTCRYCDLSQSERSTGGGGLDPIYVWEAKRKDNEYKNSRPKIIFIFIK